VADEAYVWADAFNLGPERQLTPRPSEDADLIARYYELEQSERHLTAFATSLHRRDVDHWYRVLTYYYRALNILQVRLADDVWSLQSRILRLGTCAAKSALDETLAGYYVGAFRDIRQMADCLVWNAISGTSSGVCSWVLRCKAGRVADPAAVHGEPHQSCTVGAFKVTSLEVCKSAGSG
jgi:hypothetical protein